MNRIVTICLALATVVILAQRCPLEVAAADAPQDRVLVMYFHRTDRCTTCVTMGSYSEEAVKKGFAEQVEQNGVTFYYIDFEDKKNAKLVKGYDVDGPALIVAKIKGKKVKQHKDLEDIWSHVTNKKAFLKYVQENVTAYLE